MNSWLSSCFSVFPLGGPTSARFLVHVGETVAEDGERVSLLCSSYRDISRGRSLMTTIEAVIKLCGKPWRLCGPEQRRRELF